MAIKRAVRFRPDINLSAQQTTVQGLDTSVSPPTGTVVRIVQLIAFDDTEYTVASAKGGDPTSEVNVSVLYQEPVSLALATVGQLTAPQAKAAWDAELTAFAARMQANNADVALQRAVLGAQRTKPVVLA